MKIKAMSRKVAALCLSHSFPLPPRLAGELRCVFCRMASVDANSHCPHSADGVHVGVATDPATNMPLRPTLADVKAHAPVCKCMASAECHAMQPVAKAPKQHPHTAHTPALHSHPPSVPGDPVRRREGPCVPVTSGAGDVVRVPLSKAWRKRLRGLVEAESPRCLMAQILRNGAPESPWPIRAPPCAKGGWGRRD